MDRKVKDKILKEIKKNGKLQKEYVVELIKTYDDRPNVNKLIEQYYKSKADRIMSSFKDENGIRDCFAIKDNQNKTKYIDLSKPNLLNLSEVELVRIKQENAKHNKEEVIKNWAIDQTFKPQISKEEREEKVKGWNKAVKYSYGWAKED